MNGRGWHTNDQDAAKQLAAADRAYEAEKHRARALPCAQKISALRAAKAARRAAYAALTKGD